MSYKLIFAVFVAMPFSPSKAAEPSIVFSQSVVSERKGPRNVAEQFVTDENLMIVRDPEKVSACILRYIAPPKGSGLKEQRYEETQYAEVPSDAAAKLQSALLSESNFDYSAKGCFPRYHTRLKFQRGEKTITIDFCFSCRILSIMRDAQVIGDGNFKDPVFLDAMRTMFPEDAALKKIR